MSGVVVIIAAMCFPTLLGGQAAGISSQPRYDNRDPYSGDMQ